MPVDEYIQTVQSTCDIFNSLNKQLFGDCLQYELEVYAPEPGSLKVYIAYVAAVGGTIATANEALQFIDSPLVSSYIEGLSGKSPAEFTKEKGMEHRSKLEELLTPEDLPKIHAECVKGLLEKSPSELSKVGITPTNFRSSFENKNAFYSACHKVPALKGVGFSDQENDFPVHHTDFIKQIATLPEEEDRYDWEVFTKERIIVFSPCWDSDENMYWQAKWKQKRLAFKMLDNMFWKHVTEETLEYVTTRDVLEVQLAIPKKRGPRTGVVLSVLTYNSQAISEPKDSSEIEILLNSSNIQKYIEDSSKQTDFLLELDESRSS